MLMTDVSFATADETSQEMPANFNNPVKNQMPEIELAAIARSFGQAAGHYDRHAGLQREVADELFAHLRSGRQPATILDLGCGTGYCSEALKRVYPDATLLALDLALPMLDSLAARQLSGVAPVCGNAQALPLKSASLDLVLSSLTIQWCANPARLFAELWRVMRPGGQVLLSTFGPATLRELRAAWAVVDERVHVNEFVDAPVLQQMAGMAGFDGAVTADPRQRHYASLRTLARELKGVGAHNMNQGRASGLTSRTAFLQAEAAFGRGVVPGLGIPVTWEVLYLDLRKP